MKLQQRLPLVAERPATPAASSLRRLNLHRRRITQWRSHTSLLIMVLPGVALLLVLSYLPMAGLLVAFKNYMPYLGFFGSPWVGLDNFRYLFSSGIAWGITYNTIFMNIIFIITGTALSLGVALLLNEIRDRNRFLSSIYQSAIFFPFFISWIIVSQFIFALFNYKGLINHLLTDMHFQAIDWYNSPQYWPAILTVVYLWKNVGFGAIIYLSGMIAINPEYYEAAQLDGASKWQQIRSITLPLLKPIIAVLVLLSVGKILYADFGLFFLVPGNHATLYSTTDVIDTFVYRALLTLDDVGMSSAAGFYQSIIGFILVLAANWIVRRIDPDQAVF